MAFDPDAYLAKKSSPTEGFNPDAYLAKQQKTGSIFANNKEGVLAGDSPYKDVIEAIPGSNSIPEFQAGMKSGEQLMSPAFLGNTGTKIMDVLYPPGRDIGGKVLGAFIGSGRAAATLLNPIGKVIGSVPKYTQALGSALGGDFNASGRDITGANPVHSGAEVGSLDTGIPLIDIPVNSSGEIYNEVVAKQPLSLLGLTPKALAEQGAAIKNIPKTAAELADMAKAPVNALKNVVTKAGAPNIEKYGETYRQILSPSKSEIKNLEIKSGKDLKDPYELAANKELIIKKSADGKTIDTRDAVNQVNESIQPIEDKLTEAIASKPEQKFSIQELADEAKSRLRDHFDNDADLQQARKDIDAEAKAAIEERGEKVSGPELNEIKRGMWSKAYNAMAPNANKAARIFGNVIKEGIENAYPESDIQQINSELGDHITLKKLLENAHGRPATKGTPMAKAIGALAGHSLGLPVVGEYLGAKIGGVINDFATNPESITSRMAKKVAKSKGAQEDVMPPSPEQAATSLEDRLRALTQDAQRQRLADNMKKQAYRENILKDSASDLQPQAEPIPTQSPVDLSSDPIFRMARQNQLEDLVRQLTQKAKNQRMADIIKKETLRSDLLKSAAQELNPDQADALNVELLKSLGL